MKKVILAIVALATLGTLAACDSPANTASRNLSIAADNFEVARRISFVNGITGEVLLVTEGFCSIGNYDTARRMSVTCKTESGAFVKNYLGLSDNVFFVSEQLEGVSVSEFHYRTVFRPQSIIPDFDFQGSVDELVTNQNTNG